MEEEGSTHICTEEFSIFFMRVGFEKTADRAGKVVAIRNCGVFRVEDLGLT